jgi:hypothetical protein
MKAKSPGFDDFDHFGRGSFTRHRHRLVASLENLTLLTPVMAQAHQARRGEPPPG